MIFIFAHTAFLTLFSNMSVERGSLLTEGKPRAQARPVGLGPLEKRQPRARPRRAPHCRLWRESGPAPELSIRLPGWARRRRLHFRVSKNLQPCRDGEFLCWELL